LCKKKEFQDLCTLLTSHHHLHCHTLQSGCIRYYSGKRIYNLHYHCADFSSSHSEICMRGFILLPQNFGLASPPNFTSISGLTVLIQTRRRTFTKAYPTSSLDRFHPSGAMRVSTLPAPSCRLLASRLLDLTLSTLHSYVRITASKSSKEFICFTNRR